MTDPILSRLIGVANDTGRPLGEVLRHHFLEGILRRLGGDESFALRGSLLTRVWANGFPRAAADVDFLGTFPHDVAETNRRFMPPLADDHGDGIRIDITRGFTKGIWLDTAFPGVRLSVIGELFGHRHATTVDIGFGDPLVPPAERIAYPATWGEPIPVYAVHRATLAAWKLHGLAEWGEHNWRAKDVLDLWLLTVEPLPAGEMADAIRAAFVSRGYAEADAARVLADAPRWEAAAAQVKWSALCRERPPDPVPALLTDAIADIRRRLTDSLFHLSEDRSEDSPPGRCATDLPSARGGESTGLPPSNTVPQPPHTSPR